MPDYNSTGLAISPNSNIFVSNSCHDIDIWNLPNGNFLRKISVGNSSDSLAISPDGNILISAGTSDINFWNLHNGQHLKTLTPYYCCGNGIVYRLVISSNGQMLAASSGSNIGLYDFPEGKHINTLTGHNKNKNIRAMAISPNGRILISGGDDEAIRLWSLPDGNCIKTLTRHNKGIRAMKISPNGRILISGGDDGTIRLWSLPDGKCFNIIRKHTTPILSLAISPNGQMFASGSSDKSIHLWSLPDGNHIKSLPYSIQPKREMSFVTYNLNQNSVTSLSISHDGLILVAGIYDSTIRLWNLPDGNGNVPINLLTNQDISKMESKVKDSRLEKGVRYAFEFTLALIRLRRQFDIDIEDVSNDVQFSEFDIEIDG